MSELTFQLANPDLLKIQSFIVNLKAQWTAIFANPKFLGTTVFRSEQDYEDRTELTDAELEELAEIENPLPESSEENSSGTYIDEENLGKS